MRALRPLLAVASATVLLASGCATAQPDAASVDGYPITVRNCGTDVTVTAPLHRAIAVNQPAVELLLSLGLKERIAGLAYSDNALLPDLRDDARGRYRFSKEFPSLEAVLAREPDLVYSTFDYAFSREGIADRTQFTDVGVATYQSPSECGGQDSDRTRRLTLDDLYAEIRDVASLFAVPARGEQLIGSLRDRAARATGGLDASGVSLAWWYAGTKTPYIAGCCGAPGIMTRAVGAANAFDDSKQYWPEISWEALLDRDPTVLVLADLGRGGDGDSAAAKIAFLESDPVASRLTAVRHRRYIILGGTTMDPSIRNVQGIEKLADGLRTLGVAR